MAELAVVIANGSHCPLRSQLVLLPCLNLQNHEDLLQPVCEDLETKSPCREDLSSMPGGRDLHTVPEGTQPAPRPPELAGLLSRKKQDGV